MNILSANKPVKLSVSLLCCVIMLCFSRTTSFFQPTSKSASASVAIIRGTRLMRSSLSHFRFHKLSRTTTSSRQAQVASSTGNIEDAENKMVKVNFETLDGTQVIPVQKGEILRTALLKRGVSPHNGKSRLINCRGLGTCGTCAVEITRADHGNSNKQEQMDFVFPQGRNAREKLRLNFPPHGSPDQSPHLRLACQVQLNSDVNVKKRCGFWGQDTKDLAEQYDAQLYFGDLEFVLDDKSPSNSSNNS